MTIRMWRSFLAVALAIAPMSVAAESPEAFRQRFAADLASFGIARNGLRRAAEFARSKPEILKPEKDQSLGLIPREKKLVIWNTWSSILGAQAALDDIRQHWRLFLFDRNSERRNAAFSMNHAAFLASYRYGLELTELADKNPDLDTILNEPVPELGLPEGTFDRYKFRFLNTALATEFSALRAVDRSLIKTREELQGTIEEDSGFIWRMGKGKGHLLTVKHAVGTLKKTALTAWFPVQKNVSEWMGDTKVHRRGLHLISEEQIAAARPRLQPGDIFFERHEWYLSNMGLPGFWTHVAFYVGSVEERQAYFNDPQVQAWVQGQGIADGDFESLLQARYPGSYGISTAPQEDGHLPRVLEAISEGVSFTSLEHTGASDSLAVLRPRLDKRDKAQAILRAFHYSGRPYDFNFDFETDSSLVCSELVFKAYEPGQGMQGLRFPLSEVLGRKVSTPNNMVRQFDEQAGLVMAQCDFVLFLDGFEKEKRAVESTEDQLRASWKRTNWHILVQAPPQNVAKGPETPVTQP